MSTEVFIVVALTAWVGWRIFKGIRRGYRTTVGNASPSKKPYALKAAAPAVLVHMPEPTSRLLTYQDERKAFEARQRLWMRYEDRGGNVTERVVEIYHPEDDEVVFTWCCLKREPRTFARRSIQSWQLLPERFDYDPTVARYWDEEGTLDQSEKIPWRRWLSDQPDNIANRYS